MNKNIYCLVSFYSARCKLFICLGKNELFFVFNHEHENKQQFYYEISEALKERQSTENSAPSYSYDYLASSDWLWLKGSLANVKRYSAIIILNLIRA